MNAETNCPSDSPARPVVTLALFAYNQERYVADAVRGALAQTYSPLQIILSDDCSRDATFEIMRASVAGYAGPHEVLLNRNERNLGVAEHINRIASLAQSSIIVGAAGDDVSHPNRVELLASAFASDRDVKAVFSGFWEIGPSGDTIKEMAVPSHMGLFTDLKTLAKSGGWAWMGATFAYDRECFTTPCSIPSEIICEDRLLPFRAALLGRIAYVRQPVVLYRVHGESISAGASFKSPEYEAKHQQVLAEELDWALRSDLIGPNLHRQVKRALAGYPRHLVRSARLSRVRLLARIYRALYFSDVWTRRIRARADRLLRLH